MGDVREFELRALLLFFTLVSFQMESSVLLPGLASESIPPTSVSLVAAEITGMCSMPCPVF
jgi:hypothetical protein